MWITTFLLAQEGCHGALMIVGSEVEVVPESRLKEMVKHIHRLKRLRGQKTEKNEILK